MAYYAPFDYSFAARKSTLLSSALNPGLTRVLQVEASSGLTGLINFAPSPNRTFGVIVAVKRKGLAQGPCLLDTAD